MDEMLHGHVTTCDDMKEVVQQRKRSWTRGERQLIKSKAYDLEAR